MGAPRPCREYPDGDPVLVVYARPPKAIAKTRGVKTFQMAPYDGVLFDLFSGLLDSQPAYDEVAGSASLGSRWRSEHSRLSYLTGDYRSFDDLVAEAAERIGLSPDRAPALVARLGELSPWPEAPAVLAQLRATVKIGVVTNCSEEVGRRAADRLVSPLMSSLRLRWRARTNRAQSRIGSRSRRWTSTQRGRFSSPALRMTSPAPIELACPCTGTTDVA